MPQVLIVASNDLAPELGDTVLWRSGIERLFVPSAEEALERARSLPPGLMILDAPGTVAAVAVLRRLREAPETRRWSIVALRRDASLAPSDEQTLRQAGANFVLAGHAEPSLWDHRLEELLEVPRRRESRIPVSFEVWSQGGAVDEPIEALVLNISVHGLLIESDEPLDVGTRLDLRFALPGQSDQLAAVGQVVREASSPGRARSGIEFLILRGDARERIRAFIEREARR